MSTLGKKASAASIASSEFEELRFEDFGPAQPQEAPDQAQDTFTARYLPSGGGLVSSIFGKTRSVPAPELVSDTRTAEVASTSPVIEPFQEAAPIRQAEPAVEAAGTSHPEDPFKEFEAATQKLGVAARDAASQIFGGAVDAKTGLARLAGDVSSWWAALDPGAASAAPADGHSRQAQECHKLFGLDSSEDVMENFAATLAQTYTCAHNNLTPSREVAFPGRLYITAHHLCFSAPADKVAATLPLSEVMKAAVAGKHLTVTIKDGSTLALTGFQEGQLNDALGLLEHLCPGP